VRLHPRDAAVLFALVGREKASTTIVVDKATHVAAGAPAQSDAPRSGAQAEPAKLDATMVVPQVAKSNGTLAEEPRATPGRKRKARKAKRWLLPFGLRFGAVH
jgi:hypothetical protein